MKRTPKPITCYGLTRGPDWQQEWYETASRDARRRARELRGLGHTVSVGAMGAQVTRVGRVRMTLLTIHAIACADANIPAPTQIEAL